MRRLCVTHKPARSASTAVCRRSGSMGLCVARMSEPERGIIIFHQECPAEMEPPVHSISQVGRERVKSYTNNSHSIPFAHLVTIGTEIQNLQALPRHPVRKPVCCERPGAILSIDCAKGFKARRGTKGECCLRISAIFASHRDTACGSASALALLTLTSRV